MQKNKKIINALVSLSDKSNLEKLLLVLKNFKINIISSGGTFREINRLGYKCQEISKFTKFNEMLGGRIKTLHPKIHAGILNNRSNKKHNKEMSKKRFVNIDLVIVNFYPFQQTIEKNGSLKKIIENIDIGGPTMVRAAAKNFNDVAIITNTNDYNFLINELRKYKGSTSLKFRELMASKAFGLTAYYDSMVSNWFNRKLNIKFPDTKTFHGKKFAQLRYGENPHQKGSIYTEETNIGLKKIKGKPLSYNNYNDIFTGLDILDSLKKPSTVIIKHANPSGVSSNSSKLKSFEESFNCDPISAFGGVVVCNYKINKKIAKRISSIFFEIVLAKGFDKEALKIFGTKKNPILIDISKFKNRKSQQIKYFNNSFLAQDKNEKLIDFKNLNFVTNLKPTKKELRYAEFAFNICKFVKSNSIVISNNFSTIGIGAGQPSRLDSCRIATGKAKKFQPNKLKNSIAASDAFFPFPDGVKKLINAGVKLIIQPGGSIRDKESVRIANKAKVKMIFTGLRHFNH